MRKPMSPFRMSAVHVLLFAFVISVIGCGEPVLGGKNDPSYRRIVYAKISDPLPGLRWPVSMAFSDTRVFFVDGADSLIKAYATDGRFVSSLDPSGYDAGFTFARPRAKASSSDSPDVSAGLAVYDGSLYILGAPTDRLLKYDLTAKTFSTVFVALPSKYLFRTLTKDPAGGWIITGSRGGEGCFLNDDFTGARELGLLGYDYWDWASLAGVSETAFYAMIGRIRTYDRETRREIDDIADESFAGKEIITIYNGTEGYLVDTKGCLYSIISKEYLL